MLLFDYFGLFVCWFFGFGLALIVLSFMFRCVLAVLLAVCCFGLVEVELLYGLI